MSVPAALLPPDEEARVARLQELLVSNATPEPMFNQLAQIACEVCGAPAGLISLLGATRQWAQGHHGRIAPLCTAREHAFCAHTILGDAVTEVTDTTHDPRFSGNPLVTGPLGIRFYAGAPLALATGERVGALCVLDQHPRTLSPEQRQMLRRLAELAVHALQMRRDLLQRTLVARGEYERALLQSEALHRAIVEDQSEMISQALPDGTLVYVNPAYSRHFERSQTELIGLNLFELVHAADRPILREQVERVLRAGTHLSCETRSADPAGVERWIAWSNTHQHDAQGRLLLHSVGRDVTERKQAEQRLADSERFVHMITDNLPLRVAYLDRDRRYRFANKAYADRFALPSEAIIGKRRSELLSEPPDAELTSVAAAALEGRSTRLEHEEVIRGERRRIDLQVIPDVSPDGTVRGMFTIGIDVTERAAHEQRLRALSGTLRSVIEAIPALVSVLGSDLRYRFVNNAYERWHGVQRQHIVGRAIAEVRGAEEAAHDQPWAARALAGESVQFERDVPHGTRMRHLAVSYIPLRLESGEQDGFIAIAHDITPHRQEAQRLLQLSQRDALTGLLNRAGLQAWLDERIHDGAGKNMVLFYIDLDHFKAVNDQHGHPAGDAVLQHFAQRLQRLVRPHDVVARLGGDEFAVALCELAGAEKAQALGDKVVAVAQTPFELGPAGSLQLGASVGIAIGTEPNADWRGLLARADAALYRAKSEGRSRAAIEERGTPDPDCAPSS